MHHMGICSNEAEKIGSTSASIYSPILNSHSATIPRSGPKIFTTSQFVSGSVRKSSSSVEGTTNLDSEASKGLLEGARVTSTVPFEHLNRVSISDDPTVDGSVSSWSSEDMLKRQSEAITLVINSTWTDETFQNELCMQMMSNNATGLTLTLFGSSKVWTLPDCFYDSTRPLFTSLILTNVIMAGNTTYPNPFSRLKVSYPNLIIFTFSRGLLLSNLGTRDDIDWGIVFDALPSAESLAITNSGITGSLPDAFPKSYRSIILNNNRISGTIPSTLFDDYLTQNDRPAFHWAFTNNLLSGFASDDFAIPALHPQATVNLFLGGNNLSGEFPVQMFRNLVIRSVSLNFQGNPHLSFPVPANFFGLPRSQPNLASLVLFGASELTGTFPDAWFSQYDAPSLATVTFIFKPSSRLHGGLSSGTFFSNLPKLNNYVLRLFDCGLNGSIATNFLAPILSTIYTDQGPTIIVELSNNKLSGTLSLPSYAGNSLSPLIDIDISRNRLNHLQVEANAGQSLLQVNISGNNGLTGNLDNVFASPSSVLQSFDASHSSLSGIMPDMNSLNVATLHNLLLDNTSIDFCSPSPRAVWSSAMLTTCSLLETSAYQCVPSYPSVCNISRRQMYCDNSTRPSDSFVCIDGHWTLLGPVVGTETLVLPPSSSPVVVVGNLTYSQIIFNGLNSTLVVEQCAVNLSSVSIQLSAEDIAGLGKNKSRPLILYGSSTSNSSLCDSLSGVEVNVIVNGTSCRRVRASGDISTPGTFSALFSIDASSCNKNNNRWWIILVSVIAAVVVLALVLIVLVSCIPSIRHIFRPYSKARSPQEAEI